MPGAGHSDSEALRLVGGIVALVAVVGYLAFGWSFSGASDIAPTAIGIVVAAVAVGWTLYSRFRAT
jgi:cobalamin biosynthesis protein CobD/CbiB